MQGVPAQRHRHQPRIQGEYEVSSGHGSRHGSMGLLSLRIPQCQKVGFSRILKKFFTKFRKGNTYKHTSIRLAAVALKQVDMRKPYLSAVEQ